MNAETKLSGKGQVVIPKSVREELGWPVGTRLEIVRIGGSVTLRPVAKQRRRLTMNEFISRRPPYNGQPKSLEEMEEAVAAAMAERFGKEYKTPR